LKWLEVALELAEEFVEPVSELLARHAHQGISIEARPGAATILVRAWLDHDSQLSEKRKAIEEGLWHLSQIHPLPEARFRELEDQNWGEAWKQHYKPLLIGERLLIQPAWASVSHADRLPIFIEPGMAFGTGAHPSTRLCLEALEAHLKPGAQVVDLGCGSGILGIAALRLGADRVRGYDIDSEAVDDALKHAQRNHVLEKFEARQGSLAEVLLTSPRADVLLANILAPILSDMLASGLAKALAPQGMMILSGILDHQLPALIASAQNQGLEEVETRDEADWRALVLRHKIL
jgi:ribosomal protein L11 methyltransferase